MTQPTVYIVMGDGESNSAIAYEEGTGEVLETVDWTEDKPNWESAGICDPRGSGGLEGFQQLITALDAIEANARMVGFEIKRVPQQ